MTSGNDNGKEFISQISSATHKSEKKTYEHELQDIDIRKQEQELKQSKELHKEEIENRKNNRKQRNFYSTMISWFSMVMTIIILIMIYRSANEANWFNIPTAVQITLAGSAFASTLGLILAIIHGMFRNSPNLPKK